MKSNLSMIAMGLLIFIISCQSSDQNKQIDQKEIDEVTALLTQYSIDWGNAIKNKDASGVEAYFAPDMIYQSGTGNRQLKEDLIREIKESPSIMNSFSIVDLEVKLYSRDLALVTGGGVSNWLDPEGNEHISESRFSNVWIKNGNGWRCIIGHGNTLEKGNSEEDLVKIKKIPEKAEAAINNNNFKGWLELFDENALVMFDENENIEGKEQMSEQLSKFWVNVESDYSFDHFETKVSGEYAYAVGNVTGSEKYLETGKEEKINSRETVIYKRQENGDWKVYRLMVNKNK